LQVTAASRGAFSPTREKLECWRGFVALANAAPRQHPIMGMIQICRC
jgi:hypothetical protein